MPSSRPVALLLFAAFFFASCDSAPCPSSTSCIDLSLVPDAVRCDVTGQSFNQAILPLKLNLWTDSPRNLVVEVLSDGITAGQSIMESVTAPNASAYSTQVIGIHLKPVNQDLRQFLAGLSTSVSLSFRAWLATDNTDLDSPKGAVVSTKSVTATRPPLPFREAITIPTEKQSVAIPELAAPPESNPQYFPLRKRQTGTNCQSLATTYGVVPGVTWGSLNDATLQQFWTSNNCDAQVTTTVCQTILSTYKIVPGSSWGTLTNPTIQAYWSRSGCDSLVASVTCQSLLTQYSIRPGVSWGTLTDPGLQQFWTSNNCDAQVASPSPPPPTQITCQTLLTTYGIVPGKSWGTLTNATLQRYWTSNNCDSAVSPPPPSGTVTCQSLYSTYGIVVGRSWGTLTDQTLINFWLNNNCDVVIGRGNPSTSTTATSTPTTSPTPLCANGAPRCVDLASFPTSVPAFPGVTFTIRAYSTVREDLVFQIQQNGQAASPESRQAIVPTPGYTSVTFTLTYSSPLTTSPFTLVWYFAPTQAGFSSASLSGSRTVSVANSITSPCISGSLGGCVDTTSFPLSVVYNAGSVTVNVRAWSPLKRDMFVEIHQASSQALISNQAFASINAATSSAYSTYSVTLNFPALSNGPYNFFVWITNPGAGYSANTYNQVISFQVTGLSPPPTAPGGSAPGAYITSCKSPGTYALTFDDGPHIYTDSLRTYLNQNGIKATFFVNGQNFGSIYSYSGLLQSMVSQGHQIGLHGWSHCDLTVPSTCPYTREIDQLITAAQSILGRTPTYFRFPFGSFDTRVQSYVAGLGLRIVGWNLDTLDWTDGNKANPSLSLANIQSALNGVNVNSASFVSLSHDVWQTTGDPSISYIPQAINFIRSKGYRFVTVAECDGDGSGGYR